MVVRTVDEESSMEEAKTADKLLLLDTTTATSSADATDREPYEYVQQELEQFHLHSNLIRRSDVASITLSDVTIQETLGTGGFAVVKAVTLGEAPTSYAMKSLKPSLYENNADSTKFAIAAADLYKEAAFLAALHHPHIVGIHATCLSTDSNAALPTNFLVLDRLTETLEHKMEEWRARDLRNSGNKMRKQMLYQRIQVCLELAQTLQYLHDENVIYRDLKAENIGFDAEGTVKLFDFGLAKELKDDDKANGGKYRLSGNTGSLAYMAPEVAKGWKYDRLVDVYSFGILMWEICALQPAFANCHTNEDMHSVWNGDVRPPMPKDLWPVELQWLLKKCWSYFSKSRPDFSVVAETLQEILDDEEEEEDSVRGIKSFRFGSRRSQKLSIDSHDSSNHQRRATLRPRDLTTEANKPHKKFFGLF